ncbi:glycosyltransferase [Bacillus sp. EB106-08-02-XG196]|uniref:glycosyltransferase family 2 protein n=1 Tax=Bacillus sp. EB106-08-02-XG196 TaxID=2737049 RepID=UPI0015C43555|nr:glycosyltransferase family 2 protein [Bacillus sp. EB106-08-02-XG196]NWQ39358.1 glycosyltransferase [Bacillus sp. EB106-08-02-XG196]
MENIFEIWPHLIFIICLIFPIFHMIHSLFILRKNPYYLKTELKLSEKPLSILVPCYNEESIIETTILGIEGLNYKNYEYILINDGSTDHSFEIMEEMLDLEIQKMRPNNCDLEFAPIKGIYRSKKNPRIVVIDKFNGGKADSLNAGITYASNDLVITLDADSILDEKALCVINRAFEDTNLIAAGGTVHVLQGRKLKNGSLKPTLKVKPIVKFQIAEYLRGFYIYKASLAKADALSIISGAFGIFKRDVLIKVGGYRKTIGEDIDITLKVQHYKNKKNDLKVAYIPEAICYTEVPETWKGLYDQRIRWQKAFIDCTVLYLREFLLSVFKSPLSFFFMVDALFVGIFCSFLTVLGFLSILLFSGNPSVIFLFAIITGLSNLLYNFVAIVISYYYQNSFSYKEFLNLLVVIIFDIFIFRFFTLFCTLNGTVQYFINKEGWNKVARTGRQYHIEQEG